MSDQPDDDLTMAEPEPDHVVDPSSELARQRTTSRWVVHPIGLMIAVGVIIGGYVLSSVIGDGSTDSVVTADGDADASAATTVPPSNTSAIVLPNTPATTAAPAGAGQVTATTAPPPGQPAIDISGRRAACKFGADCLIVSFEVSGFDPPPAEYACEFSNESYTFELRGRDSVQDGCMSGDPNDSITIVIGQTRSDTVSRESLGG